jgi:hypothetical protein
MEKQHARQLRRAQDRFVRAALCAGLLMGCGSADSELDPGSQPASFTEDPSSSSSGFDGGNGSSGAGGSMTGSSGGPSSSSSGGSTLGSCAAESHEGAQDPLDLVVMMDRSGSMLGTVNGTTVWQLVSDAFGNFVQSPQAAGIGVGMNYFPQTDGVCVPCDLNCPSLFCVNDCCASQTGASCTNEGGSCPSGGLCDGGQCWTSGGLGTCDAADYANLEVPVAPVSQSAAAITSSMATQTPDGLTPTGPALDGAIQAAQTWAAAHPDHITAVVLATDGVPTECTPQDIPSISSMASTAAAANPQVLTFVIGIGDLVALHDIAIAGGTNHAYIVQPGVNTTQQLTDALNAIRGELLSCEFDVPVPDMGTIDYNKVNIEFTPAGGAAQLIGQVPGVGSCDASGGGWYYDNPTAPTKIIMCPASCDALKAGNATIDIVLGCETVIK